MQISYTIEHYHFRETTKGKGIIKYLLIDDQGAKRIVSAIAKLGFRNKIKSVHAIHHRETPLIEVLAKASLKEKILVDFTEYNKQHPRGSTQTRKISVQTTKVTDRYEESLIKDMGSLKDHKFRLFKLVALAALVFTAILSVLTGFFS